MDGSRSAQLATRPLCSPSYPDRGALARGRTEARRQGVSNVTFREGAAQSLRLPDASFDVVIFSWTL